MSSQTSLVLFLEPAGKTRSRLMRRARTLSLLSIGRMTIETAVAIVAALVARSVALLGFGPDPMVELASASTNPWLYSGSRGASLAHPTRRSSMESVAW